jgi:hypothetical protein
VHTTLLRSVVFSVLLAVIAARAQQGPAAEVQPKLTIEHPIALHAGEGSVVFSIRNTGTAAVPLNLTTGPVMDAGTHSILLKAKASIAPVVADGTSTASMPVGTAVSYQASVSGVSGASAAQVDLFNGGTFLATLPMIEIDAPLGIAIDGDGVPGKPLDFGYALPVVIAVKNADPESYRVHWILQVADKVEGQGDLDVAPAGTARISVTPTSDVFSVFDRLHPSEKQGLLYLSLAGTENVPSGLLPSRALPVDLLMRRVSPSASSFLSYTYAGILLFLGGILSVVASSVLPNMQKKVELRTQLVRLANRTTSVSTRIDSYLRVLLRLERKRIEIGVREISAWLPASADPLSHISASIDALDKRLTASEHLDELRRRHEQASTTAPPSVSEEIDTKLQAAAEQLHPLNLSEADLAATNASLREAEVLLAMLDDDAALTKLIAGNVAALRARISKFPTDYCADLVAALPGVWLILDPERGLDDPKNIVRPMFFTIDHGVAAIHLALNYAMVRGSVPSAESVSCSNPGETVRDRLAKRHCHLVDLLGTLSWRALREATNLVAQMREDIYEEDVLAEIEKKGQAEITYDTQKARPYLPVFLSIAFKDSRFNGAAALQRMVCHWSFPDGLSEYGWKVCHYFSGDRRIYSTATHIRAKEIAGSANGKASAAQTAPTPLADAGHISALSRLIRMFHKPSPVRSIVVVIEAVIRSQKSLESEEVPRPPLTSQLEIQRPAPKERSRFLAEFLRFAIAFGVALAGLLSGALGQLEKLDLIPATVAILALGFGADSIKNLLTQNTKRS